MGDKMAPEDRVARTMDLQEDIAAKFEIIKANTAAELELLPQGEKVPEDAQAHKDELNRITKYVSDRCLLRLWRLWRSWLRLWWLWIRQVISPPSTKIRTEPKTSSSQFRISICFLRKSHYNHELNKIC